MKHKDDLADRILEKFILPLVKWYLIVAFPGVIMFLLVVLISALLTGCGGKYEVTDSKHTVDGETVHRVLIGVDVEGMEATFVNRCEVLCDDAGTPGGECVEACVADKTNEFIDSLTRLYEQIEAQQGSAP